MNYQVDWSGDGNFENAYPDGYGMHEEHVAKDKDDECEGCWSPETGDPDVWFAAIFEEGAEAARCGHGSVNQYEYTREEWEAAHSSAA